MIMETAKKIMLKALTTEVAGKLLHPEKLTLPELIECYKIASIVLAYFSNDCDDEENEVWKGCMSLIFKMLNHLDMEKLYDSAQFSVMVLGTYVLNIQSVNVVEEDLPNVDFDEISHGDEDFKNQLKNAVDSCVMYRGLAEMYCNLYYKHPGRKTVYNMWLEIYNNASENLRLPIFGSTALLRCKLTPKELDFCISLYKDKILDIREPERKAMWQQCIDDMSYDYHLMLLDAAGESPRLLNHVLYKNFPPKKPSAKEISRQKQEEVSFKMETLMTLTMKMLKAEKDPSKRRVFTDALKKMFDDYYQQCLEFDNPSRATMFCRNLQISANLIV